MPRVVELLLLTAVLCGCSDVFLGKQPGDDQAGSEPMEQVDPPDAETDVGSGATPWHEEFRHRRSITINHTQVGVDNEGALPETGIGVLVSLSQDWLTNVAVDAGAGRVEHPLGYDIAFTAADGVTVLPHEVEAYDGSLGRLVAWVRLDALSKSADTTLYVYYGASGFTEQTSDPTGVWDSGYLGVWHMAQSAGASVVDSSVQSNHGSPSGVVAQAEGKIGAALAFPGSAAAVSFEGQGIENHVFDAVTVVAWYRSADLVAGPPDEVDDEDIFSFGTCDGSYDHFVSVSVTDDLEPSGAVRLEATRSMEQYGYAYSDTVVTDLQWHHLAVVRTGGGAASRLRVYVDGRLETEEADLSTGMAIDAAPGPLSAPHIGQCPNGAERLHGSVDEIRVSSTPRSSDWIVTSYNNQRDPTVGDGNFISGVGPEVTR